MKELIERLEKATGPDAGFDVMIAEAIGLKTAFGATGRYVTALPYTASIDAALTLVPKGCLWQVKQGIGCEAVVWSMTIDYDDDGAPAGHSTTFPALALCVAALKARETGK